MKHYKAAIVGAGVVGLACAAVLAETVGDVLVIDSHEGFGRESSSRSGGIVHSGIFHPTGSLKSLLCADGAPMLYKYCAGRGVSFKLTGKLILATDDASLAALEELYKHAGRSGIPGVEFLDSRQVRIAEPGVDCIAAISIPSAGVVDPDQLMKAFYDEAVSKGSVEFFFGRHVDAMEHGPDGYTIVSGDFKAKASVVVNAAGTGAEAVARLAGIEDDFGIEYIKGSYFTYSKHIQLERILTPLPSSGLALTIAPDTSGRMRIGPLEEPASMGTGLAVDMQRRGEFFDAISGSGSSYLEGIDEDSLIPGTAGISPRMKGGDFYIALESERGLPCFVNLMGIDTPGLTCALSMAREVNAMVLEALGHSQ